MSRSIVALAIALGCGDNGGQASTTTTAGTTVAGTTTTQTTGANSTGTGAHATGTDTNGTTQDIPTTGAELTGAESTSTTSSEGTTAGETGTGTTGGPIACLPPDALILLDRTQTMYRTPSGKPPIDAPDYASSKWSQAIAGIEALSNPPLDASVRFGLALWPRDPGGGQCVTLADLAKNAKTATNPQCEIGEVVIEPAIGNGPAVAAQLDPTTTTLCRSTPTGTALITAGEYFAAHKEVDREQYAVLVTDGADWDATCPDPSPIKAVQDLEKQGVKTYVVGFSSEEAKVGAIGFLNDMACAGHTAKGFPGSCIETPDGFLALGEDVPVYLQADDAEGLSAALTAVGSQLCCGCEKTCDPPEVLFALDRTGTMYLTPDGVAPVDAPNYASSKWYQAITVIEEVVSSGLDDDLRFGLELWPKDPGGAQCLTLTEVVANNKATNPQCQEGEILVAPTLGSGPAIMAAIDPGTTLLCRSTPTGAGLLTASDWLSSHVVPGRKQYVVLVTDGADWDDTCPDPSPLLTTQQIAAAGIPTYVVGFFDQEGEAGALKFLNDMACAGQTANDFAQNCVQMGAGYVAKDPLGKTPLYLRAGDGELKATLDNVAAEILESCVPG